MGFQRMIQEIGFNFPLLARPRPQWPGPVFIARAAKGQARQPAGSLAARLPRCTGDHLSHGHSDGPGEIGQCLTRRGRWTDDGSGDATRTPNRGVTRTTELPGSVPRSHTSRGPAPRPDGISARLGRQQRGARAAVSRTVAESSTRPSWTAMKVLD